MSWRLLRGCAISLWCLSVLMFVLGFIAGLNHLSFLVPTILAVCTSIAGYLFWKLANEQHATFRATVEVLEQHGMSQSLASGLTLGELTDEQFDELCEWTSKEVQKRRGT